MTVKYKGKHFRHLKLSEFPFLHPNKQKRCEKWRSINPESCCGDKFSSVDGNTWHTEGVSQIFIHSSPFQSTAHGALNKSESTCPPTAVELGFIYSFCSWGGLHSFNKYLLSTHSVPGTIWGIWVRFALISIFLEFDLLLLFRVKNSK